VAADLADADAVRRLAEETGELDVLVNDAAVYRFGPLLQAQPDEFDVRVATNARARRSRR
jgi:NADP-dependent 3-hydroxy acid dehydrogenase YdfG